MKAALMKTDITIYESLCFAFLPHHVLFNGLFYYEQTSVEMPLRLVLSVIMLH